jgi:putative ABC transport system permease protein
MTHILDAIRRDLRFSIRMLAARPGWSLAAMACLAIATGANTAAFTLVNGLLLRPLPFPEPERLAMVALRDAKQSTTRPFSLREYRLLAEQSTSTGELLARTFFPLSLSADDAARMAQAEVVSGNYFQTLRVAPFLGRFFSAAADREGGAPEVVVSHRLWRLRFGGNPSVIGQTVRLNGQPMPIVGVTPPDFVGAMQLVAADLWVPASVYNTLAAPTAPTAPSASSASSGSSAATDKSDPNAPAPDTVPMFGVMARLRPGITLDEAGAQFTARAATVLRKASTAPPAVIAIEATGFGVPVSVEGAVVTLSVVIYGVMLLLMAVACANVAALMLAGGAGRTREMAVRLSLGATRWQIARQLLTESLVLALLGCAAGSVVAVWLTQALVARLSTPFEFVRYAIDVRADLSVFLYAALAAAVATALCGIAPVRYAARVDILDVLKQSAAKGRSREALRTLNAIVVLQFAVSTMLLAGAGLLVRSYVNAEMASPQFESNGLVAASLDLDQIRVDREAGLRLYDTVAQRLSALPGVTHVSLTRQAPFAVGRSVQVLADRGDHGDHGDRGEHDEPSVRGGAGTPPPAVSTASTAPTAPVATTGEPVLAGSMAVSPGYFDTLGIAVRQGRAFSTNEPPRPRVAIVNDVMAQRLWPGVNPVGRVFRMKTNSDGPEGDAFEVIGVVSDPRERALSARAQPTFYQPARHEYSPRMTLLIRVRGDAEGSLAIVRQTIREVNQDLSIVDLHTVDALFDAAVAQRRMPATIMSIVGLLGVLLSAVGLSGVIAYSVRERAREMGIRLALGAQPSDVRWLVLRQGFTIVGIGLAVGVAAVTLIMPVVRSTLFGVAALDLSTIAAVLIVLLATGTAALWLPALWASRVPPASTLRSE